MRRDIEFKKEVEGKFLPGIGTPSAGDVRNVENNIADSYVRQGLAKEHVPKQTKKSKPRQDEEGQ